jgi:hypothetical protein
VFYIGHKGLQGHSIREERFGAAVELHTSRGAELDTERRKCSLHLLFESQRVEAAQFEEERWVSIEAIASVSRKSLVG